MISELLLDETKSIPSEIYTNSKSLYDATNFKKNFLEKWLTIGTAMLRELFEQNKYTNTPNVNTKLQIANALTKNGASTKVLLDIIQKGVFSI